MFKNTSSLKDTRPRMPTRKNYRSCPSIITSSPTTSDNEKKDKAAKRQARSQRHVEVEKEDVSSLTFHTSDWNFHKSKMSAEFESLSEDETDYNDASVNHQSVDSSRDNKRPSICEIKKDQSGDFTIGTFESENKPSADKDETDYNKQSVGNHQPASPISQNSSDPYGEQGNYIGDVSAESGLPHGKGRINYSAEGSYYQGEWVHGEWHGHGTLMDSNGDFYQGNFENHEQHGQGTMKFADGCFFEGTFAHGEMKKGQMKYEDGSCYVGYFFHGKRHGHGENVFGDGSEYQGEFRDGLLHGKGKLAWADGGCYEGEWCDGEQHGRGRETRPDGSLRHDGEWEHGHPIRVQKSNSLEPLYSAHQSEEPGMSKWHNNMGLVRLKQGKVDEAISLFFRAVKADLKDADKSSVGTTHRNLGMAYEQKGELGAARDMYRHALRQQRAILGNQHKEVASTLDKLSRIYSKEGDVDRAADLLEESLKIKQKLFDEQHPEVSAASQMLNVALSRRDSASADYSTDSTMGQRSDGSRGVVARTA